MSENWFQPTSLTLEVSREDDSDFVVIRIKTNDQFPGPRSASWAIRLDDLLMMLKVKA